MTRPRSLSEAWPGLKRSFAHFWPYLRQHRALLAGSLLALVFEVGLRALEPWPLKYIFDHLFTGRHRSRLPSLPALEGMDATTFLTLATVAIVVLTGLRVLADYANTIGFATVGSRVLTKVRAELFSHVQHLSLSFHNQARTGDLILRVMSDVNQLKDVLVTAALPLVTNVLLVVGMLGVMFWLNWKLALTALIPLPLLWICTACFIRDGRDVCLSVLDWNHAGRTAGRYSTWELDPVATTALWWRFRVELGQADGRTLGSGLYHEVRYEDLVAEPAKTLAAFCTFLGIPYDEAMIRFHEGPAPKKQDDHPWRPITPGARDWRLQMPSDACLRFEAAAGDLLEKLGYPRAWPQLPPDARKQAAEFHRLFTADATRRKERLPEPGATQTCERWE
jgi:hypothetical protein